MLSVSTPTIWCLMSNSYLFILKWLVIAFLASMVPTNIQSLEIPPDQIIITISFHANYKLTRKLNMHLCNVETVIKWSKYFRMNEIQYKLVGYLWTVWNYCTVSFWFKQNRIVYMLLIAMDLGNVLRFKAL